jgi:hypothetical protein
MISSGVNVQEGPESDVAVCGDHTLCETFNAVKELWELSIKFTEYIFAFTDWINLVHKNCGSSLERFLETATEKEEEELTEYSKMIMDCTKHLSTLQGKMVQGKMVELELDQ